MARSPMSPSGGGPADATAALPAAACTALTDDAIFFFGAARNFQSNRQRSRENMIHFRQLQFSPRASITSRLFSLESFSSAQLARYAFFSSHTTESATTPPPLSSSLSSYRRLLKAIHFAFSGDAPRIQEAIFTARGFYHQFRTMSNPSEIAKQIAEVGGV